MHVHTDRELEQNVIKKFNKKYNVQVFGARMCGGKAFSTEQKIRELEMLLFKFQALDKRLKKRFKLNKLIAQATDNMNNVMIEKYGLALVEIEAKSYAFRIKY